MSTLFQMPPKGRKRPIEEATTNGTDNAKKKQRPRGNTSRCQLRKAAG